MDPLLVSARHLLNALEQVEMVPVRDLATDTQAVFPVPLGKGTCQCTVNLSELSTRLRVERIAYPQPAMLSPKRASNMRNAAKLIALPKIEVSRIIWRTISKKHNLGRTLARKTATLKTRYQTKRA